MIEQKVDVLTIRQHFPSSLAPTSSFWVFEQVRDLIKKGITFKVISPQPYIPFIFRSKSKYSFELPHYDNFNGVEVVRPVHLRIPNYKIYKFTNWSLGRSICKNIQSVKFKLIHAHFGNDGVAALLQKKKLNIPLITSFYGYDLSDQLNALRPFYKRLSKEGDLFLALSENMKHDLVKIGFPKEKILIHHLGVNVEELNTFLLKEKKGDVFTFLVVARFDERKGIHDTISAFQRVVKVKKDVVLRVVGNGPYLPNLISLVKELNLEGKVIFIDNFRTEDPRATVLQEMSDCDVFLLNSYVTKKGAKEGTPLVLMEAQGIGKACIATRHAGIPEIVINGLTGITVEERNIDEISEAMFKLIDNPKLLEEYGSNGREHIRKEFNNEIQQNRLHQIYLSFL